MTKKLYLTGVLISGALLIAGCGGGGGSGSGSVTDGGDPPVTVAARQFETDKRAQERDGLSGLNPILSRAPRSCKPDDFRYGKPLVRTEDYYDQFPRCSEMRSANYNIKGLTTWIDATVFVPEHKEGDKLPVVVHTHGWGGSKLNELPLSGQCQEPGADPAGCAPEPGKSLFDLSPEVLGALREDGYIVVSFSSRGWGQSEGDVMLMNPYHDTQDAIAVLDWIADMGRKGQLPVAVDEQGDFPLALMGGSYGGAFQFPLAALDSRPDALVSMAAWHSLEQSMVPNGVVKGGYASLLCLSGVSGRYHSYLNDACLDSSPMGGLLWRLVGPLMPLVRGYLNDPAAGINDVFRVVGELQSGGSGSGEDQGQDDLVQLFMEGAFSTLFTEQFSLDLMALAKPLVVSTTPIQNAGLKKLVINKLPEPPKAIRFVDEWDRSGDKLAFVSMSGLSYLQGLEEARKPFREGGGAFALRPLDVLLIQGMPDPLFSMQEAVENYRYLSSKGGDVRLLTNQGGHTYPITQPDGEGSLDCGAIRTVDAARQWINAKVRGADSGESAIPKVCLSLDDEVAVTLEGIPGVDERLDAQLTGGQGYPMVPFQASVDKEAPEQCTPVYTGHDGEVLAGVPRIDDFAMSADERQQVQIGLCVRRGEDVILLDDQINAFDSERTDTKAVELSAVGFPLRAGDRIGVYAVAHNENFNFLGTEEGRSMASNLMTEVLPKMLPESGDPPAPLELGKVLTNFIDAEAVANSMEVSAGTLWFVTGYDSKIEFVEDILGEIAGYDNVRLLTLLSEGVSDFGEKPFPPVGYTVSGNLTLPVFSKQSDNVTMSVAETSSQD